jgi:MoaA/NifB/PqqE/SkfB family radical SAM enzyme
MAEIGHRANQEHVELGTVVPLKQPYVLLIDPSNLCNHRCRFCPTGNKELIRSTDRYNGHLDFELYKKIINDLKAFDEPIRVLRLYKEGEPLVSPNFTEMVAYAKKTRLVKRIDTTTNGALLNRELNLKMIESGLDRVNVSVNGVSSGQIEYYTRAKVDFADYVANIRHLYENRGNCEIFVKSIKEILTEDERDKFFEIFGEISDRIYLENLSPAWPRFEFDGMDMYYERGNYGQDILERKACPYIFYIMVVNSSGFASTCVGDWPNTNIVGDLRKQTVNEVWNGLKLNEYRKAHLTGKRKEHNAFCGACQVISHGTLDNIDPYIGEILGRMRR